MPGSTTQSQNVEPWQGAQDALTQNITQSQYLLTGKNPITGAQEDPKGFNPVDPSLTYTPLGANEQAALNYMGANAYKGVDTANAAYGYAGNMLTSGGLMPYQQGAVANAQGINSGQNSIDTNPVQQYYNLVMGTPGVAAQTGIGNIATGQQGVGTVGWQALMNRLNGGDAGYGNQPAGGPLAAGSAGAPPGTGGQAATAGGFNYPTAYDPFGGGPAAAYLGNYASGAYLDPGTNPYFSKALDTQSAKTAEDVNRQFSGLGRYGSGAHTGTLASEIGNTRTAAMQNQFNQNQALQQQAVNALGGERQSNIGNQMNILSQEQAAGGQNIANRMAAAGLLGGERQNQFNQGQSLINNLNSLQGQNIGNVLQAGQQIGGFAGQGQNTLANLIGQQGNMYNALMAPGATLGQIGQVQHGDQAAWQKSLFDYQNQGQQAVWDRLAAANAIATGAGKLGSETRQSIPVASQIGSLLGNVLKFPIPGLGG